MKTVIETEEELKDWLDYGPEGVQFATNPEGPWIIYCGDDGDEWYALRPVTEDDGPYPQAGVLTTLDELDLPITVKAAY